jgi:HAD superfamily hydrolase (TIGR01456 family)
MWNPSTHDSSVSVHCAFNGRMRVLSACLRRIRSLSLINCTSIPLPFTSHVLALFCSIYTVMSTCSTTTHVMSMSLNRTFDLNSHFLCRACSLSILASVPRSFVRLVMRCCVSSILRHVRTVVGDGRTVRRSSHAAVVSRALQLPRSCAVAFDIDGVLLRGRAVLPGAISALRAVTCVRDGGVHPQGLPHIFLTNGGGVLESEKAHQLSKYFGIDIDPQRVILSHSPMAMLGAHTTLPDGPPAHGKELVLTIGYTDVRRVARSYGFEHVLTPEDLMNKYPTLVPHLTDHGARAPMRDLPVTHYEHELESIAAVLVMHDPVDWYRDLQIVLDVLTLPRPAGHPSAAIYFSNPDFVYSGAFRAPRLAQGGFRVCLAALYEQMMGKPLQCNMYGKPLAVTYEFAEQRLQQQSVRRSRGRRGA